MMLDEKSQGEVNAVARTTGILILSLCTGVVAFGAFVLCFYEPNQEREMGVLTYLSFGFAVFQAVLSFTLPRTIINANRKRIADGTLTPSGRGNSPQTEAGKLAAAYQTSTIIACGLLEGAAFLGLIAYMVEGQFAALAAAVVMLLCIASNLPISDRLNHWVEQEQRTLNDERLLNRSK